MKKKLLAAAIMAAMTISTASVFAAPIEFSGDMQLLTQKNQNATIDNPSKSTFSDVRIRLNADAQLGDNMYVHGRLMGIDTTPNYGPSGTGSSGASVNMEQLFLGAKLGEVDVKVGRQPLDIGKGMLADVNGIQGVSLAGQAGTVNMYGFAGRSDNNGGRDTIGLQMGTNVHGVNLGAGYLTTNDNAGENKYLALNADKNVTEKVNLSGVYVKNTELEKDGYIVKATVGQVAKKGDFNYAVSYRDIEAGAVDGDWVTNGAYANSKGIRLAANYKVTDNATLSAYKDFNQENSVGDKANQARVEMNINF